LRMARDMEDLDFLGVEGRGWYHAKVALSHCNRLAERLPTAC